MYEAIERGDYPEWELYVQIMDDHEHSELDFDPLDPTKLWYKDAYPWHKVGKMVLNKNPENYFAEVEQVAFGTGVLVDGLDFLSDKLLQGRTFAYSDTQRYRLGTNYLQLPINRPKNHVATNQEAGQMDFRTDFAKHQNPHVNYEPSLMGGLNEATNPGQEHQPYVEGIVKREKISRENNFGQAGETYRRFNDWERDELVSNLVDALSSCRTEIQERMIDLFTQSDADYGRRVAEVLKTRGQDQATKTEEAVHQAEQIGHPSDPY